MEEGHENLVVSLVDSNELRIDRVYLAVEVLVVFGADYVIDVGVDV